MRKAQMLTADPPMAILDMHIQQVTANVLVDIWLGSANIPAKPEEHVE
tara:strand:- start:435 stop:578 length:144 start_codon:yes stop_codon:yes gene_type:complete